MQNFSLLGDSKYRNKITIWQYFEFNYHAPSRFKIHYMTFFSFKRTIHNEIFSFLDCSEFHAQVPAPNPRDRGGVTWSKWTEKSTDPRLSRNTIHCRYRLPEYGCKYKCVCMGGSKVVVVVVVVRGGGSYARCNPHVDFEKFQKIIKQIKERHEKNINLIPNLFFSDTSFDIIWIRAWTVCLGENMFQMLWKFRYHGYIWM